MTVREICSVLEIGDGVELVLMQQFVKKGGAA